MNKPEKFWDRISNFFDKRDNKNDKTFIKTHDITKKHLKSSAIVMDYACGTGTISCAIADHVIRFRLLIYHPEC